MWYIIDRDNRSWGPFDSDSEAYEATYTGYYGDDVEVWYESDTDLDMCATGCLCE